MGLFDIFCLTKAQFFVIMGIVGEKCIVLNNT